MNDKLKKLLSLLLVFLFLLPCLSFAEETEDVEEEWEELADVKDTLLATDVFYHTPNELSAVKCDHELCFWNLEMGRMNEEAIWKVLTQPVTVLTGKQREQVRILAEPDEKCTDYVGVVTCTSQGVHVLQQEGDWSLIEAYSSSEEGSAVKVFAEHFQGWVKTSRLKTEEVDQTYALKKENSSAPCCAPPVSRRTKPTSSTRLPPGNSSWSAGSAVSRRKPSGVPMAYASTAVS